METYCYNQPEEFTSETEVGINSQVSSFSTLLITRNHDLLYPQGSCSRSSSSDHGLARPDSGLQQQRDAETRGRHDEEPGPGNGTGALLHYAF